MSSSDRRFVLGAFALLPLAACGFTPAYAPGGPAEGLLGQILVDAPEDKDPLEARIEADILSLMPRIAAMTPRSGCNRRAGGSLPPAGPRPIANACAARGWKVSGWITPTAQA